MHGRFVHRFSRSEPRESALACMRGLIAPLQRKNGWTLAEEAGHAGPDRFHRMLNRIEWDAGEVLDDVRRYVVDHLGARDSVLVVDDTGFLKKGTRSAGVQRQYSGTAGRTENCQTGVFLAYTTDRGRTLIDRRLYPPSSWTDDRERCRRAGIGDEVAFETKCHRGRGPVPVGDRGCRLRLLQGLALRAGAGGRLPRHGHHPARHRGHPLGGRPPRPRPVQRSAAAEMEASFLRQRGPRTYGWARVEVRPWHRPDRRHWVLARRSVARPQEISYCIAYCPTGTTLDELIRVAGSRRTIEECFQSAKQECGLGDYQVRRYPGWHRHMTLATAAHACLTVLRAREADTGKAETDPPSSSTSASPKYDD
ncbi:hypothetical protein EASAB2608_00215 [Streptomyces sp. EAS-AB2608]|nr:hypothetical protein EASAB2608_00215 [Streptomyces sp. EAS-AB2608]